MNAALIGFLTATIAFAAADYDSLAAGARESVRITMPRELLASIAGLPLGNATALTVHSFTYEAEGDAAPARLEAIRNQVRGRGLTNFLDVRSREPQERVEAYSGTGGVVLIASEPHELTIVELEGGTPADIATFANRFGLPAFETGNAAQPADRRPAAKAKSAPKIDLGALARRIETQFAVKRESIPMWLVKPFAFRSGLDLAVWEQTTPEMRQSFHDVVRSAVPAGWVPFVEVREAHESTTIWIGGTGDKAQMLIATVEPGEASLVKIRARVEEWTQEPVRWSGKKNSATNATR